jgi:hypothetical protein
MDPRRRIAKQIAWLTLSVKRWRKIVDESQDPRTRSIALEFLIRYRKELATWTLRLQDLNDREGR